jgi:hypothetical protein
MEDVFIADGGEALEEALVVYDFGPLAFGVEIENAFVTGTDLTYHFGTVGD